MKSVKKVVKIWWLFVVVSVVVLLSVISCTEQQMQQVDEIADVVQDVTEGGEAVLESPAGDLISDNLRSILETVGFVAMSLILGWREWRGKQANTAVKEIVTGIEVSKEHLCDKCKLVIKTNQKTTQKSLATVKKVVEIKYNNNMKA
ncbi:unnamed protein product [marine sediment metagenome]|uniref:Uncharacterized protein n=1 Tax=marine sediment metagenome TaxID=412755 RepID=X1JPT8_9ZZZZ